MIIRRGAAPVSCFLWDRGYFTSFYQKVITRRLTVHPAHDRFNSNDVKKEFANVALGLRTTFELKRFGNLGGGEKRRGQGIKRSCLGLIRHESNAAPR